MKYTALLKISLYAMGALGLFLRGLDSIYVQFFKRSLFTHLYFRRKRVTPKQKHVLVTKVKFYQHLNRTHKSYFEHRVARFIEEYEFIGREGFEITDASRVRVAAVYVMLTFGMRNYLSKSFAKIIIYPRAYMSISNKRMHKGEYNPKLKIVVFSWSDFIEGIAIENDNLHLGIHEFAHVLTFNSERYDNVDTRIFSGGIKKLISHLSNKSNMDVIRHSGYIREYAFTNSYEFIAVLLEYFFESPTKFKELLPEVYEIIKNMLNFNTYRWKMGS